MSMEEKPRVVVTRSRGVEPSVKEFNFKAEDILPGELKEFRTKAWKIFKQLPMPTTADEAWRRTDLRLMPSELFHLSTNIDQNILKTSPKRLIKAQLSAKHSGQVVLIPGGSNSFLDQSLENQGVVFSDLVTSEQKYPELVTRSIGQVIRPEDGKYSALAAALSRNGIFLYVPKGIAVELPFHGLDWAAGTGGAHISHTIIWLDDGASATFVHESASPDESGASLHVSNLEILLEPNSSLKFVELQSLSQNAWNFTHTRANVKQGGSLDWVFGGTGSRLTKAFAEMDLTGEGASGRMSGFYFTDGIQHIDLDTQQNHHAPHTTSDLLYKGAVVGNSRVVWQGMIYVAPGAQKTDGYQANRNLVLSKGARADSIPGLEILADDVRCSHGATVGKIDDDQLFYLNSRGIPRVEAERLIVEGFFDPVMQRIPFENVRGHFQKVIQQKMKASSFSKE